MRRADCCLFLVLVLPLLAQDTEDFLEMSIEELLELDITTASKSKMKADEAPGIVSVLTREDLVNLGAETLEDALNLVPGITVGRSLQGGLHETLYVRGSFSLYAETVLILKNGQRLNDPVTGGAFSFSPDFPLSRVKQIEIIRGPGSALYGANAFAALINIITDEGDFDGTRLDVRYGDNSGTGASFGYGRSMGGGHFAFSVDYQAYELTDLETQDFVQFESPNPPPFPIGINFNTLYTNNVTADNPEAATLAAAWEKNGFYVRLDYEDKEETNNWATGIDREPFTDALGTYDLSEDPYRNRHESEVLRLGLGYGQDLNDKTSWKVAFSYNDFEQLTFYNWINLEHVGVAGAGEGLQSGFISPREAQTLTGEISLEWSPREGQVLVAGYSYQSDDVENGVGLSNRGNIIDGVATGVIEPEASGDILREGDRTVNALYAQYTWQVNSKFALTGGVRADDYSDFGSTVNPRLAAVYVPSEKVSWKALYGQAFRAPSFVESNNFVDGGIIPNDNLEPEEIKTLELQVLFKPFEGVRASISAFSFEVDNVLRQVPTFNPDSDFETQTRNQGLREGEGVEIEFRRQTSVKDMLFFNYAHVSSTDTNDTPFGTVEGDVEGVPQDSLNLGWVHDFNGQWLLGVSAYHRWNWTPQAAISLPDIVIPGLDPVQVNFLDQLDLPDYTIVNLMATARNLVGGMDVSLDVKNVLDEQMIFADQHLFAPSGISAGGRIVKLGLRYNY